MIQQLSDYIAKCDVPGSQGKQYGDNNNCMDGSLALVEWEDIKIIGKKYPWPRARKIKLYLGMGSAFRMFVD